MRLDNVNCLSLTFGDKTLARFFLGEGPLLGEAGLLPGEALTGL